MTNRGLPPALKLVGAIVRVAFMVVLLAVILRVASPQNETIWSAYETPDDLVRMALGLAAGIWILVHLFIPPKDPAAYRTWLYLGIVVLPFAIICAVMIW